MKKIEINNQILKELLGLGWSRTRIAEKLGICRRTLYRHMKENKLTGELEPKEMNELMEIKDNNIIEKEKSEEAKTNLKTSSSNNENQEIDWSIFDEFESNVKSKME